MVDPTLAGIVATIAAGGLEEDSLLNAVLVLGDFLEEHGDPRADAVRQCYLVLYDDWLFAPLAFRHHGLPKERILPLFPELSV